MDQNDIDAMMNGGPEPDDESTGGASDASQPESQGAAPDAGASNPPADDASTEVNQADIDALLSGGALPEDNAPTPPEDDASLGVNQADIDALLSGGGAPEPVASSPPQNDDAVGVDQSDIDALMAEAQDIASQPIGQSPAEASPPAVDAPASAALDSTGKPMDEMAMAMAAAIAEEQAEKAAAAPPAPEPKQAELPVEEIDLPDFDVTELAKAANQPLSLLYDVDMHVRIELGRTNMFVEDVLKLGSGSVVELDRLAGDPVDVYVNGRMVARGEVLVLNDNFCVRISEVVADPKARLVG